VPKPHAFMMYIGNGGNIFEVCVPDFGGWWSSPKQWVCAGEISSQTIRDLSPIDFGEKENFLTGDSTVAIQCMSIDLWNYHNLRYALQHGEEFWKNCEES
jgi:hypothetical protein